MRSCRLQRLYLVMVQRGVRPLDPRVLMTVEEYFRTPFDGPDRDYVDGEVVERNIGVLPHAILQTDLARMLGNLAQTLGIGFSRKSGFKWPRPVSVSPISPCGGRVPSASEFPRFLRSSSSRFCRRRIGSFDCSRRFKSTWCTAPSGCGSSTLMSAAR